MEELKWLMVGWVLQQVENLVVVKSKTRVIGKL
jgi:hypothetical protein